MDERQKILTDVADGKISVEEANLRLATLEAARRAREPRWKRRGDPAWRDGTAGFGLEEVVADPLLDLDGLRGAHRLLDVRQSYLDSGMSWGFWFALFFFMLSLLAVVASALSRNSRWLHVRIREQGDGKPRNIAFSFPIPFRFASKVVTMFSWAMPEDIRDAHLDEIIQAVEDSISTDEPIEVFVDEENGNHVEIFIG